MPRSKAPVGKVTAEQRSLFERLRLMLEKHKGTLTAVDEGPTRFMLKGKVGPATVAMWKGTIRAPVIPVAWVEHNKRYVSYHLMGIYGRPAFLDGMSHSLRKRLHGKACFNFSKPDEALFGELALLTARSIEGMKNTGFIV